MTLTIEELKNTAKELQENYSRLAYSEQRVLKDLQFQKEQLNACLTMKNVNPGDVWKLRDYLVEMLECEGREVYPFSKLSDSSANLWFIYKKTW